MIDDEDKGKEKTGNRLQQILGQKAIKALIIKEKKSEKFNPIICYKGGTKIHGYESTTLVDICKILLELRKEARKKGKNLTTNLEKITDQAEILVGAFANIAIDSLIDEATGYQYVRPRDELQRQLNKILGLHVLDKPQKWEKIFPWPFYQQIFRLYNRPFDVENIKRPSFIGTLTNKYVYQNLPKGVLEKLKKETPRGKSGNYKYNLHRLLTTEVGREDLRKTIYAIEALLSISENMEEFKKLEAKYRRQKELLYVDLGLAIENEKEIVKEDFDKKFKALLSVPSSKKKK